MCLTEHIQKFDGILHTSSLCTSDPVHSKRFSYLLDKLHDLMISYARRRPVPSISWNLTSFSSFRFEAKSADIVSASQLPILLKLDVFR